MEMPLAEADKNGHNRREMVVLHGSWLAGEWLLWGEETSEVGGGHRGDGERTPADDPRVAGEPELWGCDPDALARALAAFESGGAAERVVSDARIGLARLPANDGRIASSRHWLRRGSPQPSVVTLRRVWALPLRVNELFLVLGATTEGRRLAPGVMAGNDVGAWSDLFRMAGAVVARRQVLPGVRAIGDVSMPCETSMAGGVLPDTGYESRWEPALDRAEVRRFAALAAGLPGVALCLSPEGGASWPCCGDDRQTGAAAFFDEAVDRLVRLASVTTLSRAHAERGRTFSAHDAWGASLRGDTRTIRWESRAEIAALAEEVARWRRPVDLESRSPLHLCFELEDPKEESAPWMLRYRVEGLGPTEEDGRVDWEQAWHDSRVDVAGREGLLTALGQAALIAPIVATGGAGVKGALLTTDQAHRFMRNDAPLLQAAGFDVRLPSWWQGDASHIQVIARVTAEGTPVAGSFTLASLVDVDWQIAIGGEPVTAVELARLAETGHALVRFRDRWVEINHGQINEALKLWKKQMREVRAANDIIRMMLGVDSDAHGLAVAGVEAGGWLGQLMRRLRGETALEPLPPPAGFCGTLRPYQERGYAWLAFLRQWGLGACLADDMGLGKTIQALALIAREREQGERRPVLLVCPTSVLTNWAREAARFVPTVPVHVHHGAGRSVSGTFAEEAAAAGIVVTSYNLLYRDYASIRQVAWAGLILDEAQNIKNPDTRQAQAARALQADYRIALTGTPVENQVGDLWSIMDFLNPGLLGARTAFRETFALPIKTGIDLTARDRLRQTTAPFVLRRLKTDRDIIRDLPEKREASVYCTLTREQASLYQGVLDELGASLKNGAAGISRRGLVLASITRLKQVCNHPAHFLGEDGELGGRSGKLDRLREMVEEVVAAGEGALVFTQYAAMGKLLQRHLQQEFGCFVPFLHGGTPRAERDAQVAAFQAHAGAAVFVLSLKAGGIGINLTRANHVFHFDRWWNPAVENQATDRAFRIGQTRNVMVHKFVCGGTLEDRIEAMIREKSALADDLVASGESWLTELNDTDLRDALALAQDAVGEWTP
jgi:hypothetical protein